MHLKLLQSHHKHYVNPTYSKFHLSISCIQLNFPRLKEIPELILKCRKQMAMSLPSSSLVADAPIRFKPISASLDLTEENINLVLADAKVEASHLFSLLCVLISLFLLHLGCSWYTVFFASWDSFLILQLV